MKITGQFVVDDLNGDDVFDLSGLKSFTHDKVEPQPCANAGDVQCSTAVTAVPEPHAYLMFGAGAMLLAACARLRGASKQVATLRNLGIMTQSP